LICGSSSVQRFGKTGQNKQRFRCNGCHKTFVYKQTHVKRRNEQHWFKLWVKEGFSIRQLCVLSGHSKSKLERLKEYWLNQVPSEAFNFDQHQYLIYDGTYFHKDGCFISLMNAKDQKTISHMYAPKEGFKSVYPWFLKLKEQGLYPKAITMDGEKSVIRAIQMVWPQAKIQRCLYHILSQGLSWLRAYPKTQAGRELRALLMRLTAIQSVKDRDFFFDLYRKWFLIYKDEIQRLPKTTVAFKDLKRTVSLINNAIPNMFHYLNDPNIPATTNALEGFYSRLKQDYRKHPGLSQKHKVNYLSWYCYYKNGPKTNTF